MYPKKQDKNSIQQPNIRPRSSLQSKQNTINRQQDSMPLPKSIQSSQDAQKIEQTLTSLPFKNSISPSTMTTIRIKPSTSQGLKTLKPDIKHINEQKKKVSKEISISSSSIVQNNTSTIVTNPLKSTNKSSTNALNNIRPSTSQTIKSQQQPNPKPISQQTEKDKAPKEKVISSQQNYQKDHTQNLVIKPSNIQVFSLTTTINKNKPLTSQTLKRVTNTPTANCGSVTSNSKATAPVLKNQRPQSSVQNKIIINLKPENILYKINKCSEIPLFQKEVELFKNRDSPLINLEIETKFINDKDFLNFCDILIKVAPKIKHFTWSLSGKFQNEETCKSIGEIIGKCTSAFSIILDTGQTYFTDKAALPLTVGLNKLSNLRILSIKLSFCNISYRYNLSESGNNKINRSIDNLKQLERVNYNGLFWRSLKISPNLRNYVFQYRNQNELKLFEQEINPLREQIVELELQKNHEFCACANGFCQCYYYDDEEEQINYKYFFENAICYAIKNLHYLTKFSEPKLNSYDYAALLKRITPFKKLITDLTLSRKSTIYQILTFDQIITPYLPINPKLIYTDLFIN